MGGYAAICDQGKPLRSLNERLLDGGGSLLTVPLRILEAVIYSAIRNQGD